MELHARRGPRVRTQGVLPALRDGGQEGRRRCLREQAQGDLQGKVSESPRSLRVDRDGALTVLTLDRPDVLNAFDEALTTALGRALDDSARDSGVRCVVITGAGRSFSAGQDLRDRLAKVERAEDLRLGGELRRRDHPIVAAVQAMRETVAAALQGVAAG